MPLSSEAQALFNHAKQALPKWLTSGVSTALEWLYAFTDVFDSVRVQGQTWLDVTFLDTASGIELDQHALDRGTSRRLGESDPTLRERLRQITDAVTEPVIKANVNAILAASGLGVCHIINLRRDRGHHHSTGSSKMFYSRGYRMANAQIPMGYVVILPFGATAQMGTGIQEYLRQYGPAGYYYAVEIRANP